MCQKYQVYTDSYHKVQRLDLYKFDGSKMNPLYLAYSPPVMLPTQTMNPTAAASSTSKAKRSLNDDGEEVLPMNHNANLRKHTAKDTLDASLIWWAGVGMTVMGGAAYLL